MYGLDGRTVVRTDIFPPLILLGRLLEVDLKSTVNTTKFQINLRHFCVDL